MPRSLTGRIVGAFALLAVVLWLAIGATMFVALRSLHADATSSSLADIAQTFAVRVRGAVVDREIRQVIAQIRDDVSSTAITVHLLAADGSVSDVGPCGSGTRGTHPDPSDDEGRRDADGLDAVRGRPDPRLRGARPARPERGVGASDPAVERSIGPAPRPCRISAGRFRSSFSSRSSIGAPLAFVLSRSIARPLDRLARAHERAGRSRARRSAAPLPLAGPREVREATARVNALADELARDARPRERAPGRPAPRPPDAADGHRRLCGGARPMERRRVRRAERAANAIAEEAGRLERLVGELGAIDRLRAGMDSLRPEPIDADAVIAATVDAVRGSGATPPGSTLTGSTDPTGRHPTVVPGPSSSPPTGSPSTGSSAISSTTRSRWSAPAGSIRLEARRARGVAGVAGPAIAFSVLDDGPGFAPGGTDPRVRAVLSRRSVANRFRERAGPLDRPRARDRPRRDRDRREPQPARRSRQRRPARPAASGRRRRVSAQRQRPNPMAAATANTPTSTRSATVRPIAAADEAACHLAARRPPATSTASSQRCRARRRRPGAPRSRTHRDGRSCRCSPARSRRGC